MMCLQDSPSWRNGNWPPNRSRSWQDLESVLASADPSPSAAAARTWANALRSPDPTPAVVVQGARLRAVVKLLGELRQRVAPGRPAVTVQQEAAELGRAIHELADSLRAPGTGRRTTEPGPAQAITLPLALPEYDVLARAAGDAAQAIPAPDELRRTGDFTVKHDAAVAAQQVLALLANQPATVWTERHEGIRPDRHLVADYRWDVPEGRPVGFAEAAAELRDVLRDTRPPWVPVPADPLPEEGSASWASIPGATALVCADLLDELAARLTPGFQAGPIGFRSYSWYELLGDLSSTLTDG
jgi:hypothetical protein